MYEHRGKDRPFAMSITISPYPPPLVRFVNLDLILSRTDQKTLERVVPEPVKPTSDQLLFELIRNPDSSGRSSCRQEWLNPLVAGSSSDELL